MQKERQVFHKGGLLGMGKGYKTEQYSVRQAVGQQEVNCRDLGINSDERAAVIAYLDYIPQEFGSAAHLDEHGRAGSYIDARIVVPESMAREVGDMLNNDPYYIRYLVHAMTGQKYPRGSGSFEDVWKRSARPRWDELDTMRRDRGGTRMYVDNRLDMEGQPERAPFDPKKIVRFKAGKLGDGADKTKSHALLTKRG